MGRTRWRWTLPRLTVYRAAPPRHWHVKLNRYPNVVIGVAAQLGSIVVGVRWRSNYPARPIRAWLVWAVWRVGYWIRPYDMSLDARRWWWQRPGCWRASRRGRQMQAELTRAINDREGGAR